MRKEIIEINIEEGLKDLQDGNVSPTFDNPKDAIEWLKESEDDQS